MRPPGMTIGMTLGTILGLGGLAMMNPAMVTRARAMLDMMSAAAPLPVRAIAPGIGLEMALGIAPAVTDLLNRLLPMMMIGMMTNTSSCWVSLAIVLPTGHAKLP